MWEIVRKQRRSTSNHSDRICFKEHTINKFIFPFPILYIYCQTRIKIPYSYLFISCFFDLAHLFGAWHKAIVRLEVQLFRSRFKIAKAKTITQTLRGSQNCFYLNDKRSEIQNLYPTFILGKRNWTRYRALSQSSLSLKKQGPKSGVRYWTLIILKKVGSPSAAWMRN